MKALTTSLLPLEADLYSWIYVCRPVRRIDTDR